VSPGISALSYVFPEATRTVAELGAAGLLQSEAALLERFGFGQVHVAERESAFDLALAAARTLLEESAIDPATVDALIYTGTPGPAAFAPGAEPLVDSYLRTTDRFRFPATRLQYELDLRGATVMALDQLACTGLFGALRVA
jgi:3-oxoacyl-[acyl-carrier-protein] synthase III